MHSGSGQQQDAAAATASHAAPAAPTGLGVFGNFNFGFPGIVNTALTVVLALVGFSMLTDVRNSKFQKQFLMS